MPRPYEVGIPFFPLDVDFLQDRGVRNLRREYGSNGVMVYIAIICKMYRERGYFLPWDNDTRQDIAEDLSGKYSPDANLVRAVGEFAIGHGLFSPGHGQSEILTAHRVQVQYYLSCKRRKKISIDRSIWLLSREEMESLGADNPIYRFLVNVNNNPVNVNINSVNACNNPQKEKEKEKEKDNIHTHYFLPHVRSCAREKESVENVENVENPGNAPGYDEVLELFFSSMCGHGIDNIDIAQREAEKFYMYNSERKWDCAAYWKIRAEEWIRKVR